MPNGPIRRRALQLAETLLELSAEEIASLEGRAQLAAALRATLDMVERGDRRPACPDCIMTRPGVRRALTNVAEALATASEHVEFLAEVTAQPREAA